MICAMEIHHANGNRTVWAFDLTDQFRKACNICFRSGVQFQPFHGLDRLNRPFPLGRDRGDTHWERLSGGLNDAYEVERCLYERDELTPEARAEFERDCVA